jgi:hypothetical protein
MFAQFFVQVFMLSLKLKVTRDGNQQDGIEKVMTVIAIFGTIMLLKLLFNNEKGVPKPGKI